MIASSLRKLGVTGIATLLLVSGLATSALTAQASDKSGALTLIQSPALGSLSSLGGVSGYVTSQSGGNTNQWLTNQGIDPAAAGPITDTTLPAEAQGKLTVSGGSVSLAPDAKGVNVGYLIGDAAGTDTISASLTNVAVAPGHENDSYPMSTTEFLTWLNGTSWKGSFSMSGVGTFNLTVTWSLAGAKVTPSPSTTISQALASQFQTGINNGIAAPASLHLTDILSASPDYSWSSTSNVPYSFAYGVGQGLTPGDSVSVNLPDVVSGSDLNDLNLDDAQASGALSDLSLASFLPTDTVQAWSKLPGFTNLASATTTSDMVTVIISDLLKKGLFDTWASSAVIYGVQTILTSINTGGAGFTMQSLSTASQTTMKANTPAVMALFAKDGFPQMFAQGVSATVHVDSSLDPGTVTSLTPTGVTYAAPIEADTNASAVTLSANTMTIDPGVCTGGPTVTPQSVTATATVIDTTGAPVVGANVTFAVDSPLTLDNPVHATNSNGVATAVITLPDLSLTDDVTTHVTAHVDFGSGADLSSPDLSIQAQVVNKSVELPLLAVEPTSSSPVYANGSDSYTASITFTDQCGVPQPGKVVTFSVTGSAQVSTSPATSDENGVASVTITDNKVERVTVSATDSLGVPAAASSTTVPFSYMPCTGDQCVPPVPVSQTLTMTPEALTGGGSTIAVATVLDGVDQPISGVLVDFRINGTAAFSDGTTSATSPTDGTGKAAILITATTLDCDNLGFDVYASITVDGQTIPLTGSPAHATITPPVDACEVPIAPPQVEQANAAIIDGSAIPGATVQIIDAAATVLGTTRVDATGYWSITTPAGTPSQQITANALNREGAVTASSTAWLDTDLPAPARIDQANTQQVSGTVGAVEPSSTVLIIFPDGTRTDTLAATNGSYTVATPDGMSTGVVTVVVTDQAGNRSDPATANLVTYVPPTSNVTMTLSRAQVELGGIQTVNGKGFRLLERVSVQLCSTTCAPIANGYSGFNGQVSINFVVPDATALGNYTVVLTGVVSGTASDGFQVVAPTAPSEARANTILLWWVKWWWVLVYLR